MTDLANKGADLHTPIHPPPDSSWKKVKFLGIFRNKYLGLRKCCSETVSKKQLILWEFSGRISLESNQFCTVLTIILDEKRLQIFLPFF